MSRFRRTVVSAVLAASVAATAVCAALVSAGTGAADPAPTPDWRPCARGSHADCASVRVPMDWAHPDAGTMDVAIARRKATDPAQRIGSLISMPGGPGTSGVDQVMQASPFSPELTSRFDIVSFDPRGVGRSTPLRCDAELVANPPNLVPGSGVRLSDVRAYSTALAASCRQHTGPLIDHLDSTSAAHDLDAIRAALGEDKVTLYGRSYGTLLGQLYAEQYPSRVRALLLDSVDDHSLDGSEFLVTESRTAEDAFAEFVKWCDRDRSCPLHGRDVGEFYDGLWDRASRGELGTPGDQAKPLRPLALSTFVIQQLYAPGWPQLATQLKEIAEQRPHYGGSPAGTASPAQPAQDGAVAFPGLIFCSDWQFDIHSDRVWAAQWRAQNRAAPRLRSSFA
jgi:pimeloyl-ACP methyl ester carboxylesterase